MVGGILTVVVILVMGLVISWLSWTLMAVLLSKLMTDNAEATHPDSELIATNI